MMLLLVVGCGLLVYLLFLRSSCKSSNVLLRLEVLNFALYLHPPRRCGLVSGWLHFLHNIVHVLSFRLHQYTFVPKATSYCVLKELV